MRSPRALDLGRNMMVGYDHPDWPSFAQPGVGGWLVVKRSRGAASYFASGDCRGSDGLLEFAVVVHSARAVRSMYSLCWWRWDPMLDAASRGGVSRNPSSVFASRSYFACFGRVLLGGHSQLQSYLTDILEAASNSRIIGGHPFQTLDGTH